MVRKMLGIGYIPLLIIMPNCTCNTVVPVLGDPFCERPPAVYGHVINFPIHFNVQISGHLPNADNHLLVVRTCYSGQCKQIQ